MILRCTQGKSLGTPRHARVAVLRPGCRTAWQGLADGLARRQARYSQALLEEVRHGTTGQSSDARRA